MNFINSRQLLLFLIFTIMIIVIIELSLTPNRKLNLNYLFKELESFQHKIYQFYGPVVHTDKLRARGLMYRKKKLGPNKGMLFYYPYDSIKSVWMKNTYIPLDVLFLDSTMKVVSLGKSLKPLSLKSVSSKIPCRHFLELDANTISRLKINVGDQIHFNHQ